MKYVNLQKMKDVKSWAPMLLGAAAGVAGGAYIIDYVRNWVITAGYVDQVYDWVTRIGLTLLGVLVWVSIPSAIKGNRVVADALQGAGLGFSVVGTLGLVQKAMAWAPTSISALRPAPLAARPVVVTRRESTPVFGQSSNAGPRAVTISPTELTPAF